MKHTRILLAAAVFCLFAAGSCTKDATTEKETPAPGNKEDKAYNKKIDAFLQKYYLWNDAYAKLDVDLSEEYASDEDNFLVTSLMRMTDNDLDRKRYVSSDGKSYYRLFSYIRRTTDGAASAKMSRGVNHNIRKELKNSFGFTGMQGVKFVDAAGRPTGEYGLAPTGVYAQSPAAEAGIGRGTIIAKVDGTKLTDQTLQETYRALISPERDAVVTLLASQRGAEPVTLTAREIYPDPILHEEVIADGEDRRIGYLVYRSFDAAYDDELLEVIRSFREAQITDLVLDLRDNSGGHVISSKMLATCIAGAACEGKVYEYYRYNEARMENIGQTTRETGFTYDATAKRFYDRFAYGNYYGVDLTQYALDLRRVFVLVTEATASSSEAVINSLRGIGIDVTLIGSRTTGKNVGMEVTRFTVDGYDYELAPITFQGYNALQETVPANGLAVDHAVNDWNGGFVDFGADDPLVAKALSLITGRRAETQRMRAADGPGMEPVALPRPADRLDGMILIGPELPQAEDSTGGDRES